MIIIKLIINLSMCFTIMPVYENNENYDMFVCVIQIMANLWKASKLYLQR